MPEPRHLWRAYPSFHALSRPWTTQGGTTPDAAELLRAFDVESTAARIAFRSAEEHVHAWYGFDSPDEALAAGAGGGALELVRYRVHIERAIRPDDETTRLAPEEADRLAEVFIAVFAQLLPPDATAVLDEFPRSFRRDTHHSLWAFAGYLAGLNGFFPMPAAEPESMEGPSEEKRMETMLLAMGFDAAHLCPERGEWWLLGLWRKGTAHPVIEETMLVPRGAR